MYNKLTIPAELKVNVSFMRLIIFKLIIFKPIKVTCISTNQFFTIGVDQYIKFHFF